MSVVNGIGAIVLVLALVAGLLISVGSLKARTVGDQAMFVAGWTLVLVSSLLIVGFY